MSKKTLAFTAALLALCLLSGGCASKKSVFELTDNAEYTAFTENFYADMPVKVTKTTDSAFGKREVSSSEYNTVKKVYEALKAIKVKSKAKASASGGATVYTFTRSDGSFFEFVFENGCYVVNGRHYGVENHEKLANISFEPAPIAEDVSFFEFFGADKAKWAANFNAKTPDELTVLVNHCEYAQQPQKFTDPDFIKKVFTIFSHIKIEGEAGELSDTSTTVTYVFSLNGEEQAAFTLHGSDIVFEGLLYKTSGANSLNSLDEIRTDE